MEPLKVLLIDDSYIDSMLIKKLLTSIYNVDVVNCGKIGLDYIKNGSYDIVISDNFMPEMTGQEVLKNVKKINPGIKRILISHTDFNASNDFYFISKHEMYNFNYNLSRVLNDKELERKPIMSHKDEMFYTAAVSTVASPYIPIHHSISSIYIGWFNLQDWLTIISFLTMMTFFIIVQLPEITKRFKQKRFIKKNEVKYLRGLKKDREQDELYKS